MIGHKFGFKLLEITLDNFRLDLKFWKPNFSKFWRASDSSKQHYQFQTEYFHLKILPLELLVLELVSP